MIVLPVTVKKRSLVLAVGLLVTVVGAEITNASSDSSASRVSAPPVFDIPLVLPPAIAGTKYFYNFCDPVTAKACGGPLARNQLNPTGGNGGPYSFKIKSGLGFAPKGLVLSPRTGILTGSPVNSTVRNGQPTPYDFTVCVSDRSGSTCHPTQLVVEPAAAVNAAFVGEWNGIYTRRTHADDVCPNTVIPNRPVEVEIEKSGLGFAVVIRYYEAGVIICPRDDGDDGQIYLKMNHVSRNKITGSVDGQDFAFTLKDQNTIIGVGVAWWGRSNDVTFDRG